MIETFYKPGSITEAVEIKGKHREDALYFAGGTQINSTATAVKNLKVISIELLGLDSIETKDKETIIGSAVTLQELIDSDLVPESLKIASRNVMNRNIRNMATIGGNIGSNKSCSSLIPVLVALNAKLKIAVTGKEKTLSIYDYISNQKDELLLNIILPEQNQKITALKQFTRTANDLAILNVAVSFSKESDIVTDLCIAVGGVSKNVIRLTKLENELNNNSLPSKENLEKLVQKQVNPIDDLRGSANYKRHLTGVLVSDSLYSAYNQEEK